MQILAEVLAKWLPVWAARHACSQSQLAALCGVDKTTMSRWWNGKRGTDGELFAAVASRLWQHGVVWIQGEVFAVWHESGCNWRTAFDDLTSFDITNLRPFVRWLEMSESKRLELLRQGVAVPRAFVPRNALFETVRVALLDGAAPVVLTGMAGAGKTTLAAALAYDRQVGGQFWDGVLWAGLGPDARSDDALRVWQRLLRLPEQDPVRLAHAIAEHLAQPGRRYLLVLDDAWSAEPLALLPDVSPPHALLVTTRDRQLAAGWPTSRSVHLPSMSEEEAGMLLERAGCQLPPETAREMAGLVENHPLALALVATLIRLRGESDVLAQLRLADIRLAALQLSPVTDRSRSVRLALDLSYQALPLAEQALFRRLGVFPPGANFALPPVAAFRPLLPDSAPLDMQLAETRSVMAGLVDRGLLTPVDEDLEHPRWRLHTLVHDYARWQLRQRGEWERACADFIGYYVGLAGEFGARSDVYAAQLTAEWPNLRGAFDYASEREQHDVCVLLMAHLHSWLLITARFGELRQWLAHLEVVAAELPPIAHGWLHHAAARLTLAERDFEEAHRLCSLVVANEAVESRLKAFLCLEFVGPALDRNDPDAAIAFLAEGRRWAGEEADGDITIAICKATARLALAQGDWPAAAQQIALAGFAAHERGRPLEIVEALRWQAVLLEELGAGDEALEALEATWLALQEQGATALEWTALLELARLAQMQGDPESLRSVQDRQRTLREEFRRSAKIKSAIQRVMSTPGRGRPA